MSGKQIGPHVVVGIASTPTGEMGFVELHSDAGGLAWATLSLDDVMAMRDNLNEVIADLVARKRS